MTSADLTHDGFLGGRLFLWQPRTGYRAGIDPVLLAASVPARAGQSVLDLGCGVGAAGLCLSRRVAGLDLVGVEQQQSYAALALRNAAQAQLPMSVDIADIARLPAHIKARHFDHVITNPPYFAASGRSPAQDLGREAALAEQTPLSDWVAAASKRLAYKGYLHMIHRAERLPELLFHVSNYLGSIELLPLGPRSGRSAQLVIIRARKGGRAPFRLHPPLVLHRGAAHMADEPDYEPQIDAILKHGAPLRWPE